MSYESYCEAMKLDEMIELPQSALVIYLRILHIYRSSGHNGILFLSDNDLKRLTHFSQQTITDSKRLLKNKGFIDFQSVKGCPTRYLIPLYYTLEHQLEHQLEHSVEHPYRDNISNQELLLPPPPPPPRAINAEVEDLEERLRQIAAATSALEQRLHALKQPQLEHSKVEHSKVEHLLEYPTQLEDSALEVEVEEWSSRMNYAPLGAVGISKLQKYLKQYRPEELIAAMDTAELANKPREGSPYSGVSFLYFEKVLAGMNKPKKPKKQKIGAEKNDSNERASNRAPRRNGTEPWRDDEAGGESPEQRFKPWENRGTA